MALENGLAKEYGDVMVLKDNPGDLHSSLEASDVDKGGPRRLC